MNTRIVRSILVALCLLFFSAAARAQNSGITGVVTDASGAVLPGVTVEAASPSLIEKVRTATTDGQGRFQIIELRPGTYSVTFTLPGFSIVKREGIELGGGFTATVNADLRVGGIEETVLVSGASPIVDVQNVRAQNQLTQETLTAIPTGKTFQGFGSLTVGVVMAAANQDVGGNTGEKNTYLSVHGGNPNDQRMLIDGMRYNLSFAQGSSRWYMVNQNQVAEVVLETGGTGADTETGGVQLNTLLKDGGNMFTGTVSGNYTPSDFQGTNLDDELRQRGITTPTKIKKIYDIGGGFGGPIKRDKLWF
jgi:hypothetical protein